MSQPRIVSPATSIIPVGSTRTNPCQANAHCQGKLVCGSPLVSETPPDQRCKQPDQVMFDGRNGDRYYQCSAFDKKVADGNLCEGDWLALGDGCRNYCQLPCYFQPAEPPPVKAMCVPRECNNDSDCAASTGG